MSVRTLAAYAVAALLFAFPAHSQNDIDLLSETTKNLDDATAVILDELRRNGLNADAEDVERNHAETRQNIQDEIAKQLAGDQAQGHTAGSPVNFGLTSAIEREASIRASLLNEANRKLKELAAKSGTVTDIDTKAILQNAIKQQTRNASIQLDNLAGKGRWKRPLASREGAAESCDQAQGTSLSCARGGDSGQSTGLIQQREETSRKITESIEKTRIAPIVQRAKKEIGEGRSGAGGISLHLQATFDPPLEETGVVSATVQNGRLVLKTAEGDITLPKLPEDFLALAIRTIYGGEGPVSGTILALNDELLALKTGADAFGDVVWRRRYLPVPVEGSKVGDEIALALGPGLGFTRGADPSITTVTYYGPIANTRLGKTLFETDRVIFALETNIDGRTGKVLALHKLPGFQSQIEIKAREEIELAKLEDKKVAAKTAKDEVPDDAPWWEKTGWFVWVPEKVNLRLSDDARAYAFDTVELALRTWGGSAYKISKSSIEITDYATEHLELLKGAFPVLEDFEDAAKTVTVIRALKALGIPLDTAWARKFKQPPVTTEKKFRYVSVLYERKGGLPVFEVAQ